jgi:DNA polymerase-1
MIKLKNGFLVQNLSELPNLFGKKEIFLDIESRNYISERLWQARKDRGHNTEEEKKLLKVGGLYPQGGDRICGFSITSDENKEAFYIPIRHTHPLPYVNLNISPVLDWLRKVVTSCGTWINHFVNFDAQYLAIDGVQFDCELACTTTLSKIINSDRLSHALKVLSKEYLGYDTSAMDRVDNYLQNIFTAEHWYNWARVPIDLLGEYAIDDVLMNRKLYRFLLNKLPTEQNSLWETEKKLTATLFDMEKVGLRIDKKECMVESYKALHNMITQGDIIQNLSGVEFTNSVNCIYDILVNQFGMPVIATIKEKDHGEFIDTGRPTFDKDALALYEVHPMAFEDEKLMKVIKAIRSYRISSQFKSLYSDTFQILCDEDFMVHPQYNQTVRTGRMSAKRPNSQQQNEQSKKLVHPREGYGFISCDYSQIEFRLIAHYIKDINLIEAYNKDASTDFHQWVANMMHVKRKPAKTINFGMAYGAGKKTVVRNLMANPDIIEEMSLKITEMITSGKVEAQERDKVYAELCKKHSIACYDQYHETIPGLRSTARRATNACRMRGYIFNAYGRRRHLPDNVAYKAFNSLIQSCAMDLIKERMVAISQRYNKKMHDWDIRIAANVHDEILFECPLPLLKNEEVKNYIVETLSTPAIEFRIPMMTDYGISAENWSKAAYG